MITTDDQRARLTRAHRAVAGRATQQGALTLSLARTYARTGRGRLIREAAGLSLSEVGSAAGVATSTISRWETGQRRPRGAAAVAWAELLTCLDRESTSS